MKSILISIKPEYVEKILNHSKTIEIRKTMPKCELPCKVYIYCTKAKKPYQDKDCVREDWLTIAHPITKEFILGANYGECLNGKIVAEFTLKKIETLWQNNKNKTSTATVVDKEIFEKQTCMTWEQYCEYHKCKNGKYPNSYAWHIDDLKIYDKPKELNEFSSISKRMKGKESRFASHLLQRPPQSWCYVEEMGGRIMEVYVDELPKCCKECQFYALQWCNAVEKKAESRLFISYDKSNEKNNLCPLETTQSIKQQVREEVVEKIIKAIDDKFNYLGYVEEKFEDVKKYILDQMKGENNDN